jgi:hypothetical protein
MTARNEEGFFSLEGKIITMKMSGKRTGERRKEGCRGLALVV